MGGLEALGFELAKLKIPVRQATVGPVNKRDILMAQSAQDPLNKVILGFSVKGNSEVAEALGAEDAEIKFFSGSIIYHILDAYEAWREETAEQMAAALRESLVYPGRLLYLKDHTFRAKGPAIVGMRVVWWTSSLGQRLMKLDGTPVGQIKSLRTRDQKMSRKRNKATKSLLRSVDQRLEGTLRNWMNSMLMSLNLTLND